MITVLNCVKNAIVLQLHAKMAEDSIVLPVHAIASQSKKITNFIYVQIFYHSLKSYSGKQCEIINHVIEEPFSCRTNDVKLCSIAQISQNCPVLCEKYPGNINKSYLCH